MTRQTMTRAQWDLLSPLDRATVARTMKITDAPRAGTPDTSRLVHVGADGVRSVYTRSQFDGLPVADKARIGANLRAEHGVELAKNEVPVGFVRSPSGIGFLKSDES